MYLENCIQKISDRSWREQPVWLADAADAHVCAKGCGWKTESGYSKNIHERTSVACECWMQKKLHEISTRHPRWLSLSHRDMTGNHKQASNCKQYPTNTCNAMHVGLSNYENSLESKALSVTFASQTAPDRSQPLKGSKLPTAAVPDPVLFSELFDRLVKRRRAQGGCLGTKSRRKTW